MAPGVEMRKVATRKNTKSAMGAGHRIGDPGGGQKRRRNPSRSVPVVAFPRPNIMAPRIVQPFILAAALALLAACGSEPTSSAICTRADIGSPCSAPSSAEFLGETEVVVLGLGWGPDQSFTVQQWHIVLRTTVSEPLEYEEGGHLCVLTETQCITEECNLPEMLAAHLPEMLAINFSDASEAIEWCRSWYGR